MYYTDGATSLWRRSLSNPTVAALLHNTSVLPQAVALNGVQVPARPADTVYWIDSTTIRSASLNGSAVATVVAQGGYGLALDPLRNLLAFTAYDGTVSTVSTSGTDLRVIAKGTSVGAAILSCKLFSRACQVT